MSLNQTGLGSGSLRDALLQQLTQARGAHSNPIQRLGNKLGGGVPQQARLQALLAKMGGGNGGNRGAGHQPNMGFHHLGGGHQQGDPLSVALGGPQRGNPGPQDLRGPGAKIGRASCRERV